MKKSVIDAYLEKVFVIVVMVITGSCLCAAVVFVTLKFMGFYENVSRTALGIFTGTCVLYLLIGLVLVFKGFKKIDGKRAFNNRILKWGKVFVFVILIIQYNFILEMIPSRGIWAYLFYFLILPSLFLDIKLSSAITAGLWISTAVAFILHSDVLLPYPDENYIPELVLCIVAIVLSSAAVLLITFLAGHYLVNAKKEEVEESNNKVQRVLGEITKMSVQLSNASEILSNISQSESTSSEQLSATSASLLENSNIMLDDSKSCQSNLEQLNGNREALGDRMNVVNELSRNLLEETSKSESDLQSLVSTNGAVMDSTAKTKDAFEKLAEDINNVLSLLNSINDIASSTNILAINASIEAAHAGEMGKSFAVVAGEIRDLASRSQKSVKDIQSVIDAVNKNINEMSTIVADNSEKLDAQNISINNTYSEIDNMITGLKNSIRAIEEINGYFEVQRELIDHNYTINEKISSAISQENREFAGINEMISNNASNAAEMAQQVDSLKKMIDTMQELLA